MKARILTTLAALAALCLHGPVQAQEPAASYPSRAVRIVVGY